MAKSFGKFLAVAGCLGVAATCVCYFLKKKSPSCSSANTEEDEFFENNTQDVPREYISLAKNTDSANNTLKDVVTKAASELKEKTQDVSESVGIMKDAAKDACDFTFEEFKEAAKDVKEKLEEN